MSALPDTVVWLPVLSIEPLALREQCLCISVSHPSHCYVTAAGIITHNSDTTSPFDALPPNPKAFVGNLMQGMDVTEAAQQAKLPAERIDDIARNIGRFLGQQFSAAGINSEEDGIRQLAQFGSDLAPLAAAPKRGSANPIAAASFNHLDRWLHGKLAGLSEKAGLPEFLAKVADRAKSVPFFGGLIDVLQKQAMPLEYIPQEAMAHWREMQMKQAFGKELALDVHRSLKGEAKFTDIAYPPGFADNPAEKKKLYLYMTGALDESKVTPELRDLSTRLRSLLTEAGEEAVRQGRMSPDTLLNLQETYLPHYYEDDLKRDTVWRKAARLLGVRDVLAQRSTAWHIVDTTKPDPMSKGEDALVTWDSRGARWRFNSQEHRDAFYEDFIRTRALDMLQSDGPALTNLLAALPPEQKQLARAEIAAMNQRQMEIAALPGHSRKEGKVLGAPFTIGELTQHDMQRTEQLSGPLRGIIKRAVQLQRQRFQKREPLSVEQQADAGLIFDPVYSTVRYLAQMHKDNAVAAFFNQIATNKDWTTDTETAGFRPIPDTRAFGKLAGKHVLESIADQVLAVAGDESPVMELYDDLVRAWSSGKTVWNPGTHMRNFIGNIPFAQLAGNNLLNPANWGYYRDAARVLRDGGESLRELYERGILGGDYGSHELKSALRELLPDASLMGDEPAPKMMARVGKALFAKLPETVQRAASATSTFAHTVYKVTDDFFKVAAFLKAKEMGMNPEEAANHVRQWFPFYDNIGNSSGIKFVRRLIPFMSFQREAVRIFGNAVKERPLSLAATMIIPYVITQISAAMMGLRDKDKEEVMKDLRGKLLFKGITGDAPAFAMLLPWRSQGKLTQFDLSNVVPWANIIGRPTEAGQKEDTLQYIARRILTSSPVGNVLAATATNEDPFNQRPIVQADMTPGERNLERAKYVWNLLAPPLLGSNAAMLAHSTERSTNKTLEQRDPGQTALRAILGLDVRNATPDLYRLAEDFRREHKLPINEVWSGGTTAQQRLRQSLFGELAQDTPNVPKIANILKALQEGGKPVATDQDINRLLFYRNPLMIMHGPENQQRFRASLTGESRKMFEDALREFQHIQARAPQIIGQARSLMMQKN
jgi:hypothetical protein